MARNDPETGFHLIKREDGEIIKIADLVDDEPSKEIEYPALKSSNQNKDKDYIDIIIALGWQKKVSIGYGATCFNCWI